MTGCVYRINVWLHGAAMRSLQHICSHAAPATICMQKGDQVCFVSCELGSPCKLWCDVTGQRQKNYCKHGVELLHVHLIIDYLMVQFRSLHAHMRTEQQDLKDSAVERQTAVKALRLISSCHMQHDLFFIPFDLIFTLTEMYRFVGL